MEKGKTLVLGASTKPGRYALLAAEMLDDKGFEFELLGKMQGEVRGVKIKEDFEEIAGPIETVTVYLNEKNQVDYQDYLLKLKPKRVIFNPGAENYELALKLEQNGIEPIEACTLVMLSTGQY